MIIRTGKEGIMNMEPLVQTLLELILASMLITLPGLAQQTVPPEASIPGLEEISYHLWLATGTIGGAPYANADKGWDYFNRLGYSPSDIYHKLGGFLGPQIPSGQIDANSLEYQDWLHRTANAIRTDLLSRKLSNLQQ
jgi:hypothetical protein